MKANAYRPHLLLIPEDPALHDIAIGFAGLFHNVQVDPPVMGKTRLKDQFLDHEVNGLKRFPLRYLVLVQDYDGKSTCDLEDAIPDHLKDRVSVLGPLNEAENLRSTLRDDFSLQPNTWDEVGRRLAEQCLYGESRLWGVNELAHLKKQIETLRERLLPILELTM